MTHKRLNLLLVLLICIGLSGCAPATPSEQPTAAPVATSAPAATAAPTQAAPTAAPTAVPPTAVPPTAVPPTVAPASSGKCVIVAAVESSGEKMSMDPSNLYVSGGDGPYLYAVYERLVTTDNNFNVIPQLAEKWESNKDASEWTFHLRQGVKFHDGKVLDSGDVVYSYQRILDPATGSAALAILSPVLDSTGITAPDPQTVVFRPKEPNVSFPLILTTKETGIVAKGAKQADLRLHENGTGPFMQDFFEPGATYTKLKAFPDYWQKGMPVAPCLEIRTVQEATTAVAALQAGDVDMITSVDPAVIPTLKSDPKITLLQSGAGTSMVLSMWTDTKPFDDVRVRKAMKMVVDRQEILDTVLLGFGETGADNPIPISDPLSYLYGKQTPAQDIAGAKALLAEAGYTDAKPLTIDLYSGEAVPGYTRLAQVYKEQAAKAGIIVNIIQVPADGYWDNTWLKKPFVNSGWTRRPVVVAEANAYACNSQYPETHWCRPEFDKLIAQASAELDPAARADILHKMQQMIADDGGVITPVFMHSVAAIRSQCTGYEPNIQNSNYNWTQIGCK